MTTKSAKIPKEFPAWVYTVTQERSRQRSIILSLGQRPKANTKRKKQARKVEESNDTAK